MYLRKIMRVTYAYHLSSTIYAPSKQVMEAMMDDDAIPGAVFTRNNKSSDPVPFLGRRETSEAKISRKDHDLAQEADLDDNWEDAVIIGEEFTNHNNAVIKTLSEFNSM